MLLNSRIWQRKWDITSINTLYKFVTSSLPADSLWMRSLAGFEVSRYREWSRPHGEAHPALQRGSPLADSQEIAKALSTTIPEGCAADNHVGLEGELSQQSPALTHTLTTAWERL